MNKLIIAFCVMAFFFALIEGMASGNTSYASTQLTGAIAEDDADFTMNVRSTSGFEDAGYIDIGSETLEYNGKTDTTFTHCEHSAFATDASSHAAGSYIYSQDTGVLNAALGFTVIGTGSTASNLNIMTFGWNFVTKTVPKLVSFDYSFMESGPMQYVRYFFLCISAGFVFICTYMILSALGGVAQSIFVR